MYWGLIRWGVLRVMIEFKHVSKAFKTGAGEKVVLKDISALFSSAHNTLITGSSGVGKSTLLSLLGGIDIPTSGAVLFDGIDLASKKRCEREDLFCVNMGYLFQFPYLVVELSVLENCMVKGLCAHMPMQLCRERGLELLDRVGLVDYAEQSPVSLSGGQQQRVALVRALFMRPRFLFADEPIAHLDPENAGRVLELIQLFKKEYGMGLIMSCHDGVSDVQFDRIFRIDDGLLHEIK